VPDTTLTPEQQAEAQHLCTLLQAAFLDEAQHLAQLLTSKDDSQLLGRTEFEVRESLHRLGARTLETALNERKKRGTRGRA
jgi:hypothetical protein